MSNNTALSSTLAKSATRRPFTKATPDRAFVEVTPTTHATIARRFSNMLENAGAISVDEKPLVRDYMDHRKNWRADIVADFAKVEAFVEVKPMKEDNFAHAIKQVLLYASVSKSDKLKVCIVTNGVYFYAFNPSNFSLVALKKNRTVCPSRPDASAIKSLKRQSAFKALVANEPSKVADLAKMSNLALGRFLKATVGVL